MNLCCLTMIFQNALEEEITDFMLAHETAKKGFHSSRIDGHSHDVRLATMKEKVRGRAQKTRMDIILGEEEAQSLLLDVKAAFPDIRLTFWISPVNAFGRLS
ncbi:MAG: DUF3240 family protein [Burkholderiales bacterium]|nr:DUF3240 family protein [Burkholderiales bacterium]